MTKKLYFQLILTSFWIYAAIVLALRVCSLRFNPEPNPFLFWVPYLVLVSITAFLALTKNDNTPIIFIIGLALLLHSINVLRQPGDINWGKDAVHDLQIASRGLTNGHFVLGDPTLRSHAYDQSFFPGLELLTSSLSLITKIPLDALYNYTAVPVNLLTLPFFFYLMKTIVKDRRIVNTSILIYALCPSFNFFNSFTLHESLAIVFFPLVLTAFLQEKIERYKSGGMIAVTILSMILVTITNEFASYLLFCSASVIVGGYFLSVYLWKPKSPEKAARVRLFPKLLLLLLCGSLIFLWLRFAAEYYLEIHGNLVVRILNVAYSGLPKTAGGTPPYSLSFLESSFSYLGFGLCFLSALLGMFLVAKKTNSREICRIRPHVLIVWGLFSLALIVLFELIPWNVLGENPIRFRSLEFSYFGIAPLAAIGIHRVAKIGRNSLLHAHTLKKETPIIALMIIVTIAVPTILVGFPYYEYDGGAPKDLTPVNSVGAYFTSIWISKYSTIEPIAGTRDGTIYVSGYAAKTFLPGALRTTIQNHKIAFDLYYINLANILVPDAGGFRIGTDNFLWLTSNSSRIYDNGQVIVTFNQRPETG